jgi:hypothetical protein
VQGSINDTKAIYEECKRRKKNLSIAWIDYQKAFDSIPNSWVEKSIELVGVNSKIVRFLQIIIKGEMEHNASAENKAGSNAVTSHSDTKRNIPRGLFLAITLLYSNYPINTRDEQRWLWISSTQS